MNKQVLSWLVTVIALVNSAGAITPSAKFLVHNETKGNAAGARSEAGVLMPHLEIPFEMVGVEFTKRLRPEIAASLVFMRDGHKYVRWILNPEDTQWSDEVIKYFAKEKGIQLTKKYYFTGYQTASRSYIAEDPKTHAQFSVKSSTNVTGGSWRDKKQPVGEAIDSIIMGNYLAEQNRLMKFKYFTFMDEPAILKLDAIDQAVVIRDLNAVNQTGPEAKYYLPGFSALHEVVGKEIALKNGSPNPYDFWTEHYVKVAGKALGELAARTGLQFDSPHSQNFLVELDPNFKPTGRLVLRDLADLYVDQNFIHILRADSKEFLGTFTQKSNILNYVSAGFGPLHGNEHPSWVDANQYAAWKDIFFDSFESSIEEVTGVPRTKFKSSYYRQSGAYFLANYELVQNSELSSYMDTLVKFQYPAGSGIARCESSFLNAQ